MNHCIAKIGAVIVTAAVALFAIFLPFCDFGSYFVCIFLALGYLLMLSRAFTVKAAKSEKLPQPPGCYSAASMRF